MSVLSEIRALPAAIRSLTEAVQEVVELMAENGPAIERLEALERSRATWEAEAEGSFLKADSRYKAAAAAEARSRVMEKNASKLADPFAEEGDEVQEGVSPEHALVRAAEALQPMYPDVGSLSPKELALRMKFS